MKSHRFEYEVEREKFVLDVTEAVWSAMADRAIDKAGLAAKLGTSQAYVTRLLNGNRNLTLRTLFDIAAALELTPRVTLTKTEEAER